MTNPSFRRFSLPLAAPVLALAFLFGAHAQAHEPANHAHPAMDEAHAALHASGELNLQRPAAGEKWATDAPLREGMSGLNQAFSQAHEAFAQGQLDADGAQTLADQAEEQVRFLFANCNLPADADAELHHLLEAVLAAAASLRAQDDPHPGLHQLHRVLRAYPAYFDHPGWEG